MELELEFFTFGMELIFVGFTDLELEFNSNSMSIFIARAVHEPSCSRTKLVRARSCS